MNNLIRDIRLPDGSDYTQWLKAEHRAYPNAQYAAWRREEPFLHFFIPNLLDQKIFKIVSDICIEEFSRVETCLDEDERGMEYCLLLVAPLVEFFCGPNFRELVGLAVGRRVRRALDSVPQLRRIIGPRPALPSHSDEQVPFAMATFFSVHNAWTGKEGGELILEKHGSISRLISPEPNALYGMVFGSNSFHRVQALTLPMTRATIYQEWDFDD